MKVAPPPSSSSTPQSDSALWKDVCLASAWFHRAQQTLRNGNGGTNTSTNNNANAAAAEQHHHQLEDCKVPIMAIIPSAERALSLYQSCHRLVKKRRSSFAAASGGAGGGAVAAMNSLDSSSKSTAIPALHKSNRNNNSDSNNASSSHFTINLELRMAQTLRFLALVHSSVPKSSSVTRDDNNSSENPAAHHLDLEAAIKYHDMAVSLLVGVFDEEEEEEEEDENENNNGPSGEAAEPMYNKSDSMNSNVRNSRHHSAIHNDDSDREPQQHHQAHQQQNVEGEEMMNMDVWSSTESFSDPSSNSQEDDNNSNDGNTKGRVMLTIRVPNNANLNTHTLQNSQPNIIRSTSSTTSTTQTTTQQQASFLFPTEDQRVRAIAVSLNALAELHARAGDDRAAMDSYREALEILRAATEEEQVEVDVEKDNDDNEDDLKEEDNIDDECDENMMDEEEPGGVVSTTRPSLKKKSSSASSAAAAVSNTITSPVQTDLANTLMNVGNFHLRRDELDAALNAYSTVWALHSGNSLDQDAYSETNNSHVPPSTPSSSVAGGASSASVSFSTTLPYLTPPTVQSTFKSLGSSTPPFSNSQSSSFATPNNNNSNNSSSPGALVALNNLGIVHERRGELTEALACFEYVHRTRLQVVSGRENIDTVNSLINIGNCYQRLQEWERACMAYEESVRLYRKLLRYNMIRAAEGHKNDVDGVVKLHRSLAGALRNWGTCCWKRRRISEAIDRLNEALDAEGQVVTLSLPSDEVSVATASLGGTQDHNARQAKESMAQLAGLLGCLYLEYKLDELKSFDKSEGAFQRAIQLYQELGYDISHPSVVWARHNLMLVGQARAPPPPPPRIPTPPSAKPNIAAGTTTTDDGNNEVVDLDEIDSVELDQALAATFDENVIDGDGDEDSHSMDIFSGVDANSTDELDEFLSQGASPFKENVAKIGKGGASFEEEVDFDIEGVDEVAQSDPKHNIVKAQPNVEGANTPLSNDHRNISSSWLNEQGHEHKGPQHTQHEDDNMDERLSQLQLQTASDEGESVEAAHAHCSLAEHFWEKGDRVAATEHYTEAHSIYTSQLGDSSREVAMVLKKLGDLNQEDDILDTAKELYMEALEMEFAVLGEYLPQTLNAAGASCLKQDDFRSAWDFHRRALQIQKRLQGGGGGGGGQNKYEMYETYVLIGNVYYGERNNFSNIRSNGVDYQEFINSGFLGWIANAHDMRGEYIKSIQFYEESLQISMSRKEKEAKRETSLTLNRLGSLTRELGRYDEAMDYHQKALNIQKSRVTGKAMTAETCVLMGMVKSKMGEFQSALDLYEDSLLVLKSALGEEHLSVSKTMAQIGSVHFEMSNYEQAMAILLEAERCQIAFVGENNRDTLETQALIGRVLSATGKFEEALHKLRNVSERQVKLFGANNPNIGDTLSFIGACFLEQDMATEARLIFVDCYNMRKHFFTVDQIHIADSMVDIIRARNGQPERALAIYKNAHEVYKEYLPDDHVQIGRLHVYEGDSYAELLNFSTAIERYEQAKQIFSKTFGGECTIDSALVAVSIGKVLLRKCDYDSAKTSFTSALTIYQQILPECHKKITGTLNSLDRVEQEEALCV